MSDKLAAEHPRLLESASALLTHLAIAGSHLRIEGDVSHVQHGQFAERLESLHQYLIGAFALVWNDLYMLAFAILRSALEHHVQDHLLFLGNRFTAVIKEVSEETANEWTMGMEEGREEFAAVLEIRRLKGNKVELVRSGPHFTGEDQGPDARSLSIYYPVIFDNYDPFTGGKTAQEFIGEWPYQHESKKRWAVQAADLWGRFLRWQQLKANLLLNEFYTERELARWEVHFSFLSAFTHPTARGFEALYGFNSPKRIGYDHYASELGLLYIITIAQLELDVFEQMTHREPVIGLADWDGVRTDTEVGMAVSSHLWFPRGAPHRYDRVEEANRRGTDRTGRLIPADERPKPDELVDEDVYYYSDPFKRVVALHSHQNELTGFPFVSDWPRQDARYRR